MFTLIRFQILVIILILLLLSGCSKGIDCIRLSKEQDLQSVSLNYTSEDMDVCFDVSDLEAFSYGHVMFKSTHRTFTFNHKKDEPLLQLNKKTLFPADTINDFVTINQGEIMVLIFGEKSNKVPEDISISANYMLKVEFK